MPERAVRPLGELIENLDARRLPVKEADRRAGPHPYYGASGIVDYVDDYLFDGLHLLIAEDGENLRTQNTPVAFLADGRFWVNNHAHVVRANAGADTRFLCYALRVADIGSYLTGSTMPKLTQANMHRIPVFAPALHVQRKIAAVLGSLDDKIELNRRMNETLETMAEAIFRDWFVDFGPVRRKMEGATDPVAVMGGLTPDPARAADLAALFPDTLGNEGLPEGWATSSFGSEFRLIMGQSPPGDTYNDDRVGLPFFQGRTDFGFRYPEQRKHCSAPARIAEADDTLISVRAPVGDLNVAWERCCIGRGVAATRHKSGGTSFTFYALRSLQPELEQFEHTGTVFGAINKKQFEALKVLRPASSTVGAFERLVAPLDDMIRTKTAENRTLAETRDYLLPRLMSGAVRVASAEAAVTEAA